MTRSTLAGLIFCCLVSSLVGDEPKPAPERGQEIQPFGGLRWDDRFPEILKELQSLEDVRWFCLLDMHDHVVGERYRVKEHDLAKTVVLLKKAQYSSKELRVYSKDDSGCIPPYELKERVAGRRVLMDCYWIELYPIAMGGSLYSVKAALSTQIDVATLLPERSQEAAAHILGEGTEFVYPVYLELVVLRPMQMRAGVPEKDYLDLKAALEKKYGGFQAVEHGWQDRDGNKVTLTRDGVIKYSVSPNASARTITAQQETRRQAELEAQRQKERDAAKQMKNRTKDL